MSRGYCCCPAPPACIAPSGARASRVAAVRARPTTGPATVVWRSSGSSCDTVCSGYCSICSISILEFATARGLPSVPVLDAWAHAKLLGPTPTLITAPMLLQYAVAGHRLRNVSIVGGADFAARRGAGRPVVITNAIWWCNAKVVLVFGCRAAGAAPPAHQAHPSRVITAIRPRRRPWP